MRLNLRSPFGRRTHEGGPAWPNLTTEQALRRTVLSCLLWESEFYEDGTAVAERIVENAEKVAPPVLAALAVEARTRFNLRHAPLLLLTVLARTGSGSSLVSDTIVKTIQRADELAEFLAIYWRNGKTPLSAQVKKGLARAFGNFDAYQLAKYNRDYAVKLRDVMFLVHPKPADAAQADIWRKLADNDLESPDTWEVSLSAGTDKKATFERLLRERKLGYLALLRNLRNMVEADVDPALVTDAILARRGASRLLPFRYVAAARACPRYEPAIDEALSEAIAEQAPLPGRTVVLVDVSGSMDWKMSRRSDLTRLDAAAALASIIHGDVRLFTFSDKVVEVPARRGMAGVDAIRGSQRHIGTYLGRAVAEIERVAKRRDRLIVVTDEQAHDAVPKPSGRAYMINVGSYQNGVGYGPWVHIDGFSEQVLRFIHEYEAPDEPEAA